MFVYNTQGRTYLCKKLDLGSKVAVVRPADVKYYTKTVDFVDVLVTGGNVAFPAQVRSFHIGTSHRAACTRVFVEHGICTRIDMYMC